MAAAGTALPPEISARTLERAAEAGTVPSVSQAKARAEGKGINESGNTG